MAGATEQRVPIRYGHGTPDVVVGAPSPAFAHSSYVDEDSGQFYYCDGVAWLTSVGGSQGPQGLQGSQGSSGGPQGPQGRQGFQGVPGAQGGAATSVHATYRGSISVTVFLTILNLDGSLRVARTSSGVTQAAGDPGFYEATLTGAALVGGDFIARWDEGAPLVFAEEIVVVPLAGPQGPQGSQGADFGGGTQVVGTIDGSLISWNATDQAWEEVARSVVTGGSGHNVGDVWHFFRPNNAIPLPAGTHVLDGSSLGPTQHDFPGGGTIVLPDLRGSVLAGADPTKPFGSAGAAGTAPGETGAGGDSSVRNLAHSHAINIAQFNTGSVAGASGTTGSGGAFSGSTGSGGGGNTGTTHATGATNPTTLGPVSVQLQGSGSVTGINHTHNFDDGGHNHTTPAHSHSVTIGAHTHSVTVPSHSHTVNPPSSQSDTQLGNVDVRMRYVGLLPICQVKAT